jgi:hypothetical protein
VLLRPCNWLVQRIPNAEKFVVNALAVIPEEIEARFRCGEGNFRGVLA